MPLPVANCGPEVRKNGTSEPSCDGELVQALGRQRLLQRLVREDERGGGVGAAAAEARGDGDPLLDLRRPARLDAGGAGEQLEGATHERVLGEAGDA